MKTLHPKVHGGLLHKREAEDHVRQAKEHDIPRIDLVVVNLYPFEETIAKEDVTMEEAIENIDIGGPSMLRSAAKNASSVTVVSDPDDYGRVLEEMQEHSGDTSLRFREELAVKVFRRTAAYDTAISNYLGQCDEGTAGCYSVTPAARPRSALRRQPASEGAPLRLVSQTVSRSCRARNSATPTSSTSRRPRISSSTSAGLLSRFSSTPIPAGSARTTRICGRRGRRPSRPTGRLPSAGVIVCNRPTHREPGARHQRDLHRRHHRSRTTSRRRGPMLPEEEEPASHEDARGLPAGQEGGRWCAPRRGG